VSVQLSMHGSILAFRQILQGSWPWNFLINWYFLLLFNSEVTWYSRRQADDRRLEGGQPNNCCKAKVHVLLLITMFSKLQPLHAAFHLVNSILNSEKHLTVNQCTSDYWYWPDRRNHSTVEDCTLLSFSSRSINTHIIYIKYTSGMLSVLLAQSHTLPLWPTINTHIIYIKYTSGMLSVLLAQSHTLPLWPTMQSCSTQCMTRNICVCHGCRSPADTVGSPVSSWVCDWWTQLIKRQSTVVSGPGYTLVPSRAIHSSCGLGPSENLALPYDKSLRSSVNHAHVFLSVQVI